MAELGGLQEAAGAFRRALEADPDNWRAHYNLADVLEELGEHAEAAHPLARVRAPRSRQRAGGICEGADAGGAVRWPRWSGVLHLTV